MDLELGIVLSCTGKQCQVRLLTSGEQVNARYCEPMLEHQITAQPGQLIALDRSVDPLQIVYRYPHIMVVPAEPSHLLEQASADHVLIRDGQLVDLEHLRAESFVEIQAMYERLEAVQQLDPKRIVEQGYDRIAKRYLEWSESNTSRIRERYTSVLLQNLHAGASVLELGCGAGVPVTQTLARRFEVTGVDISARQIALARQHVPQAYFVQADMAELDLPPGSYDGIAAFYTLFHVPREQQPQLLGNIASWLRPGGLLVATMGTQASKGDVEDDWLGAPMYWSSYDSEINVHLVRDAGLDIIQAVEETVEEHGEQVAFLWIVARKLERI